MITTKSFSSWLYQPVDNSGLVVFRVVFGLLLAAEGFGALLTGWVTRIFVETKFTFGFIGFQWLADSLHGEMMYYYYGLLGVLGLLIAVGFKYKLASFLYWVLWWGVYLSQKTHYNNHYFLMVILTGIMFFLPAHRYFSIDAKRNPSIEKGHCQRWVYVLLVGLVAVVYFHASINKLYPDWLEGKPIALWFKAKRAYPLIGSLLQEPWLQKMVSYGGILFDGLAVPLLLWRRTRWFAVVVSVFFHLFNSVVFQIGVFPYLMIGYLVLFFPPDQVRKRFFTSKEPVSTNLQEKPQKSMGYVVIAFLVIQFLVPFRHRFIEGDVFFTEEGHRMSWRMMLRSKRGYLFMDVVNNADGSKRRIRLEDYMNNKQMGSMAVQPDMLYTFVQRLKKEYQNKGADDISIYAEVKMRLNRGQYITVISKETDLAAVDWNYFGHCDWIETEYVFAK